jgi:hypothetical protein
MVCGRIFKYDTVLEHKKITVEVLIQKVYIPARWMEMGFKV